MILVAFWSHVADPFPPLRKMTIDTLPFGSHPLNSFTSIKGLFLQPLIISSLMVFLERTFPKSSWATKPRTVIEST